MSKYPTPRHHRGQCSHALDAGKAIDLVEAVTHAMRIDRPLNRFITIHLDRGGVVGPPQVAITHYLKMAGQWLRDHGEISTFVWVIEDVGTGVHVHILLHCPARLMKQLSVLARSSWLRRSGIKVVRKVICSERIGPRGFDTMLDSRRQTYFNQMKGLVRYILKCVYPGVLTSIDDDRPPIARRSFGDWFGIRTEFSAEVCGKRCSQSNNLGKSARTRWLVALS